MNRYWDLTEAERAVLTAEQVEAMLVVECMEKGVARIEKPMLETVEEVSVRKKTYYRVGYDGRYSGKDYFDALFDSPESAQQLIDLNPMAKDSDYSLSTEHKYAKQCSGYCVERIELAMQDDVLNIKPQLERQAAAKKRNESLLSVYNAAAKKVDDAVSGVYEDWRQCRSSMEDAKRIAKTFVEYTGICDGDQDKAMTFLLKAFDTSEVRDAMKMVPDSFLGIDLPQEAGRA